MIIRDYVKIAPLAVAIYNLGVEATEADYELAHEEADNLGVTNLDLICIDGKVDLPTTESTDLVDDEFSFQGSIDELVDFINDYGYDDANPLHRGGFKDFNEVWVEDGTLYGYIDRNDGTEFTYHADDLEKATSYTTTAHALNADHFHDQYQWQSTSSGVAIASAFVTDQFEQHIDSSVDKANDRSMSKIQLLAQSLSDLEYHELCHQLHGTKSEFDGLDDGECHVDGWPDDQKRYFAVKSALYRGIFWRTLNELE